MDMNGISLPSVNINSATNRNYIAAQQIFRRFAASYSYSYTVMRAIVYNNRVPKIADCTCETLKSLGLLGLHISPSSAGLRIGHVVTIMLADAPTGASFSISLMISPECRLNVLQQGFECNRDSTTKTVDTSPAQLDQILS